MKQPDKVLGKLVGKWLARAEEDYNVAEHLIKEKAPFFTAIGFHAQQAAEKYIKAFLVRYQIEFPKTHDLGELLELLKKVDAKLAESLREITVLTPYGVDIRYPDDGPEVTLEEAK